MVMKRLSEYLFFWTLGGTLYYSFEMIFRGFSHWSINIYGCNSGNLSQYINNKSNITSALSKIVSGDVYAYDGNVAFGPTWSRPFRKYGKYEDRLSNIQKGYIKIALKNRWFRKSIGKVKYKDGELYEKCDE